MIEVRFTKSPAPRAGLRHELLTMFGLAIALVLSTAPARAAVAEPTASEATAAVEAGVRQANDASHGFVVKPYVLFDTPDPLSISPDAGEVDAVIVGTPLLMLQYNGYLAAIQGQSLSPEAIDQQTGQLKDTLHFIIFAHAPSGGEQDKGFLSKFEAFQLTTSSGQTLPAIDDKIFGPAQDFFSMGGTARSFRWLGTSTVGFKLPKGATQTANLSFTDSTGRKYQFTVDPKKYR